MPLVGANAYSFARAIKRPIPTFTRSVTLPSFASFPHYRQRPLVSTIPLSKAHGNGDEQLRGSELPHHRFVVSSRLPCRRILEIPKTLTLRITKLLTFTLHFFLHRLCALTSLHHIPNGRIPHRFASQSPSHGFGIKVKVRSLPRLILRSPHSPSHAPDLSCS